MSPLKPGNSRSTDVAEDGESCLGAVYMFLLDAVRQRSMDSADAGNDVSITASADAVSVS